MNLTGEKLEQVWNALAAVDIVEQALGNALEDPLALQAMDIRQLQRVLRGASASASDALITIGMAHLVREVKP